MSNIYVSLCFFLVLASNPAQSQDTRATTEEGRTVILKKTGVWFFIDRSQRQDSRATIQDGRIVILSKDGKWSYSNEKESIPPSSQDLNEQSDNNTSASKETGRYYNSIYHFSIRGPNGWSIKKHADQSISWNHPSDHSGNFLGNDINIRVDRLSGPMELDEYVRFALKNIVSKNVLVQSQESERGTCSIVGHEARWFVYLSQMGPTPLKFKIYLFVHGQLGYRIAFLSVPEEFSQYNHLFEQTAQSIQFE